MTADTALVACHQALAVGSRSFALAKRLLPPEAADRAAVLYAWCRRADDAVDLVAPAEAAVELVRMRGELAACYGGAPVAEPVLAAFQRVAGEIALPRPYPDALLDGLAMDVAGTAYPTVDGLLLYCHRVAGVVGLMMSHVFGVRDDAALRNAAHLGIAMQLTNICRDVAEDWERGRLYLPDDLLAAAGAGDLRARLGAPIAALPRAAIRRVVEQLLALARTYYASGDRGVPALPWRAALAVRAARRIYARIGDELARRAFDPLDGRVVVGRWRKRALVAAALAHQLAAAPRDLLRRARGRLGPARSPRIIVGASDVVWL